ncbi:MAG: NAD(P)/FAD-dependent oxidoreductase [Propionibacteriaceae bacterium]
MTMTQQTPHPDESWEVVIVGGGAAGLSAALILARARRRVLVLDAGAPRNRFAPHLHGVLSRDGYSPLQLVEDGRREVRAADGVVRTAQVVTARRVSDGFDLETDDGQHLHAGRLIVATGIRDELPAVEGLAEQWGRGVVACPYCDGYEARGSTIGVLAGSPMSLHVAQMLRAYSADLTVFTQLIEPVEESELRSLEARGIRVDDRPVRRVVSDGDVLTGLELVDGTVVTLDVVFASGRMVLLDDLLRQLGAAQTDTPWGPWTASDPTGKTDIEGLWVAGNSANPGALVPIAAASGVTAAVTINAELVADDVRLALAQLDLVG